MKRILAIALALTMVLTFAACGKKPAEPKQPEPTKQTAANEYGFAYRGTEIAMHASAAPILEALGEPKTYTEAASCAFSGLDKTYFYGSFYLTTYPNEDGDHVSGLWFVDDGVATPEGITIGSARADVVGAYGEFEGEFCTLKGDTSTLTIVVEGDNVSAVRYIANIE